MTRNSSHAHVCYWITLQNPAGIRESLPGTVEKIVPTHYPSEPELYKEIRVENRLQDEEGNEVGLNPGAEVDVTIEAEPHATISKKPYAVAT